MVRSMADALLEVYKTLGTLTSTMQAIQEDIKDIKENQEVAAEARQAIAQQMGDFHSRLAKVELTLNSVSVTAAEVEQWKQRGIGALFIVGIGSSAVTWAIVHFADQIGSLMKTRIGG